MQCLFYISHGLHPWFYTQPDVSVHIHQVHCSSSWYITLFINSLERNRWIHAFKTLGISVKSLVQDLNLNHQFHFLWENKYTLVSCVECLPMAWETGVQSQVESYQRLKKWYLIPRCLTFSIIRYVAREKWSNLGKRVVPTLIPQCCSFWKGSLWVTLAYNCQLFTIYFIIHLFAHYSFKILNVKWFCYRNALKIRK